MWVIFKVFVEFVRIFTSVLYFSCFGHQSMWDPSSLSGGSTRTLCIGGEVTATRAAREVLKEFELGNAE